ncbi:NUDIX hydrolase [Palleronia pelagia]|uniref:8-oxo-dGTP pyrophosphatase MutT, NUDIX family n=1 Tax=Palleronia pelagia TaxID=387096 RepID=A0A1H8II89_9RHOB|nr:NUDIX hydrolase [Palleronia pelagia]SEN67982.1 8-oxo-dGTP pyrophosphatase MutT, NUDIX family [Palleronia pelagia]
MTTSVPIRDAATVIVVRDPEENPSVLMGQRGKSAVFLPGKVVFPGGRVDQGDARIAIGGQLDDRCRARLSGTDLPRPETLVAAAIRELWEETGQILGQPGMWADAPTDWQSFAATGHRPDAAGLTYVFRAITPPGRPRRFDARFFTVNADRLAGDPDDFSHATDELSHLRWIPLSHARQADLPFITQVALAEVAGRLPDLSPPPRVPFFHGHMEDIAIADAHRD